MTGEGPVLYEPSYGQQPIPCFSFDLSLANSVMQGRGMHLSSFPTGRKFNGVKKGVPGWVVRCIDSTTACRGATIPEVGIRAYSSSVIGTQTIALWMRCCRLTNLLLECHFCRDGVHFRLSSLSECEKKHTFLQVECGQVSGTRPAEALALQGKVPW